MSLERNFTRATFLVEGYNGDSLLLDVAKRLGITIVDLDLIYSAKNFYEGCNSQMPLKILQNMPQLEKLKLDVWDFRSPPSKTPMESVTLRKLKKLELEGSGRFFPLIEAPMLTELKADGDEKYFVSKHFVRLLKNSPELKSLAIKLDLLEKFDAGFPFQLKKLFGFYPVKLTDKVKKFLMSQAATIETLEVHFLTPELIEFVFTNFKRLRIFKTDFENLEASALFNRNFKPMPLLTELSSDFGFSSQMATRAVLGNCPALVKLECQFDNVLPNYIQFIADQNRNMEVLTISTIRAPRAKFQHLKELILRTVENTEHLIAFLNMNPSIETLEICQWYAKDFDMNDVCSLIRKTRLKLVKMSGSEPEIKEVLNKIMDEFRKCKIKLMHSWGLLHIDISRKMAR